MASLLAEVEEGPTTVACVGASCMLDEKGRGPLFGGCRVCCVAVDDPRDIASIQRWTLD